MATLSTTSDIQNAITSHPLFSQNRIRSLYSSFQHLVESNHEGYKANIQAWESLLMDLARQGFFPNSLSVNISEGFPGYFNLTGVGSPQGLSYVFDEAVSEHTFIPASTFKSLSYSLVDGQGWWNISAHRIINATLNMTGVYNPLQFKSWSSHMGLFGWGPRILRSERYILLPLLHEASHEVLSYVKRQSSNQSTVYTVSDFKRMCEISHRAGNKNTVLSSTDLDDLILYISRDLKAALIKNSRYVKVGNDLASGISESEEAVAEIDETLNRIDDRVNAITQQLIDIDAELKLVAVDSSKNPTHRSKALHLLRSRKQNDVSLKRALDAQAQVAQARDSLIAAGTNLDVVRTLEMSLPVLKKLNLAAGQVDEVVDEVKEKQKQTQEIGDIISSISAEGNEQIDEDQIEAELQDMAQQQQQQKNIESARNETELAPQLPESQPDVETTILYERMKKLSMQSETPGQEKEKEKEPSLILESS